LVTSQELKNLVGRYMDSLHKVISILNNSFSNKNIPIGQIFVRKSGSAVNLLNFFERKGIISGFKVEKTRIQVFQKDNSYKVIGKIHIISKPSSRVYLKVRNFAEWQNKYSIVVLLTPIGIYSLEELVSMDLNLGGEILFACY